MKVHLKKSCCPIHKSCCDPNCALPKPRLHQPRRGQHRAAGVRSPWWLMCGCAVTHQRGWIQGLLFLSNDLVSSKQWKFLPLLSCFRATDITLSMISLSCSENCFSCDSSPPPNPHWHMLNEHFPPEWLCILWTTGNVLCPDK